MALATIEIRVLRSVVKFLLAAVLCLNGFTAPVAMAHASTTMHALAGAVDTPPCHGSAEHSKPETPSSISRGMDLGSSKADATRHGAACCSDGHCRCGCIVSATFTLPRVGVDAFAFVPRIALHSHVRLPVATYAAPLRPPILS